MVGIPFFMYVLFLFIEFVHYDENPTNLPNVHFITLSDK